MFPRIARARRRAGRLSRGEAGQQLVEFAVALPLLVAIVIALFEFGRAWNTSQILTNAAREGGRLAAKESTVSGDEVTNAVSFYVSEAGLDPSLVDTSMEGFGDDTGTPVSVAVEYPYEFLILGPVVAILDASAEAPGSIMLSTTVVMRNE